MGTEDSTCKSRMILHGFNDAIREHIRKYPTYEDIRKEHTRHFKLDEKI